VHHPAHQLTLSGGKRLKILIVEDDATLADGLTRILTESELRVEHVATGEAAEAAFLRERFDLIVLDIGLPGIDGFEVLRRLRKRPEYVPVLVLSARDAIEDRVHGLDMGADDYLPKPFALPELEARVRALLRRGQANKNPQLRNGPLLLDTVARRATLNGQSIDLTSREWSVLENLMLRAGQVVSKENLMQALSNWDKELSMNAIEVYMSRLRAKVEAGGVRIRTVRGFGYLLEEQNEPG
jgi:two-component system, OmpR family, response regulator